MPVQNQTVPHTPQLKMEFTAAPNFCQVLQSGFRIHVCVGCSLKHLLCQQFGLPPDYVEGRISTIFLDGHPVDDLDRTIVHDGAILALSAAMPGLVGATMRRGGFYAELRSGISYHTQSSSENLADGVITLKLFNLLADDLGVAFLQRGVEVNAQHLRAFLKNRPEGFWQSCTGAWLDEHRVEPTELRTMDWLEGIESVELQVSGQRREGR